MCPTSVTTEAATGRIALSWNSEAGFVYQIEGSSDLISWQLLVSDIVATGATSTRSFDDPQRNDAPRRFYRVRLGPRQYSILLNSVAGGWGHVRLRRI